MTDAEKDAVVAEINRQLDDYMASNEFHDRCLKANEEIERGTLRTDASLAEALGLPERFVTLAFAKQAQNFYAENGGLQ